MSEAYSAVADRQLDALEGSADTTLWNAVVDALAFVFDEPERARLHSSAVRLGNGGVIFDLPVSVRPWRVYWSLDGPRIEAILEHP